MKSTLLCFLMTCCALSACAQDAPGEALVASDSAFLAAESHTATTVTEAPRDGWEERKSTVRFGAYGMTVTQRLDPATGLPPQTGRRWGDAFVGIAGKKPRAYMSSNWSPWFFLSAAIRLEGDEADLPDPTMFGLLVYAGLREATRERIVADVIWRDAADGLLRARLIGWRGVDRFGMTLRYFLPEGRAAARVRYELKCQPYDYSNRGHWERRRWLSTPARDEAIPDEAPLALDLPTEWQAVFHNRFAHSTSGTVLALDPATVAAGSVVNQGSYVVISLQPRAPHEPAALVLGDWVDGAFARARAGFFAAAQAVAVELERTRTAAVPPPPRPDGDEDAELADLLARHEALERDFAEAAREAQRAALAAWQSLAEAHEEDSYRAVSRLVAFADAEQARREVRRRCRSAWVTQRQWEH